MSRRDRGGTKGEKRGVLYMRLPTQAMLPRHTSVGLVAYTTPGADAPAPVPILSKPLADSTYTCVPSLATPNTASLCNTRPMSLR